jgi:hypothetical protein
MTGIIGGILQVIITWVGKILVLEIPGLTNIVQFIANVVGVCPC